MNAALLSTALLLSLGASTLAPAADWPRWRGPDLNGISLEKGWSHQWPASGPKVAWKARIGLGYSAFVVADGRVYTTGHTDGMDTLFCFDAATGKDLWKHSYPAELGDKYFQGGTTGTPTWHAGKLYHLSRWGDLFCFDAASGKVQWSKNIQQEAEVRIPDWGFTGSPFVWEDLLILNVGEAGMAVNKADGKIVWKSGDRDAGYSTAVPFVQNDETSFLLGTKRSYMAINGRTGKKLWDITWSTSYGVNAADPIIHDGKVFISSGYNKGCALLKPNNTAKPEVFWENRVLRSQMNAAVLIGDHLYGIDGNEERREAALKCVDFATGKEMWVAKETGFGAVAAADGKLLVLTATGELIVAEPSATEFKPLARAQILNGQCWTVPVLANGLLYARSAAGDMVCLDLRP